ncbi:MAG: TRAP transporter small permease [Sporomusaceae bacterium]|nr:TRAP transporter small permease [Sporomusaceae bacterium]
MEAFGRFTDNLNKIVLWASIACFGVMTFCAGAQVLTRYLMSAPLEWTEEIARFMFIYIALLGSAICVKQMSHINVDLVLVRVSAKTQWTMKVFVAVTSMVFFAIMSWSGVEISAATMEQYAPATDLPMGYVYASVPISGLLMLIYSGEIFLKLIREKTGGCQAQGGK